MNNSLKNQNNGKLVIGELPALDINPFQNFEVLNNNGELISFDSFEIFFKNPSDAKIKYLSIFSHIREVLNQQNATKLNIHSHSTNVLEIKKGEKKNFTISIFVGGSTESHQIRFNLGELLEQDEISERLEKKGIDSSSIDLEKIGLQGILNCNPKDVYKKLFYSSIGGGTHNISSTVYSFLNTIKSNGLKVLSPNSINKENDYYTKISLFGFLEGEKICVRTESNPELVIEVEKQINDIKSEASDILVAGDSKVDLTGIGLHYVPTKFTQNVVRNVLTVAFNCEDREMGQVILSVINEIKDYLEKNSLDISDKSFLINSLTALEKSYKEIQKLGSQIMYSEEKIDLFNKLILDFKENENLNIQIKEDLLVLNNIKTKTEILYNQRLDFLREIIITLVESSIDIERINKESLANSNSDIGRIVLITDGENGVVGSIGAYGHTVLFTNTIWEISGEKEQELFAKLNKLSKGQIDINISDTTGCGDNSTASALMLRDQLGIDMRLKKYEELFRKIGINENHHKKALAITDAYFLANLQEVISGIVYHCKLANLGDVYNSDKITKHILLYCFINTIDFIEKGLTKFLFSHNKKAIIDTNIYNGFNAFSIKENKKTN
ncbi:MAG: hypothetical protein PHS49_06005 [Candidatus Gracilibacteria bacterium]|nr:hypothetical protein [Candidatus Gracilibacteria bacterium]